MERDEFLSKLGIGVLAACMGCGLVSCSKGSDATPSDSNNNTNTPPAGTSFNVDLSNSLTNVGDSKISSGIILVRIAAGNAASSFTAVQVACTHEGTAINYNNSQGLFICPLHGSEFTKTGAVIQGPAAAALKQYNVAVTGTTLTVTA